MSDKPEHKIQNATRGYLALKQYVDFSLFQAYREIQYVGLEKVPTDGAIIYAPNHTNALMDALVVLSMDKKPKVFVARADIFRNPKVAKILTFLKIMPIMRIRDGMDEVRKNDEVIKKAADVLVDKVPFCILPEGTHRTQHSLQTFGKGVFRIALETVSDIPEEMPLYIIPIGLEYGNFFRFRSTVLVQIGEPINVKQFISKHPESTTPEMLNLMRDDLFEKLKKVILYIPDDERYDATYETCAIVINEQVTEYLQSHPKERRHSLITRYNANHITVGEIETARNFAPEAADKILDKAQQIYELRTKAGISLGSVIMKNPFWSRLLKLLIFIISLPYTIPSSILMLPISGVSRILFNKLKDRAFFNSIRYLVTLFLLPILILIYSIILFCLVPWEWALLGTALLIPANIVCQDSFRLLRLMHSDFKLLCNHKLRKEMKELKKYYFKHIKHL